MTAITGISARKAYYQIGLQSGKGSPATANASGNVSCFAAGAPSLAPYRDGDRLSMTDGSRDQGDFYTSQIGVRGDLPVYAHPDLVALLFHAVLGGNADSGSADPYTHIATPSTDVPWLTIWRSVGGVIFEKFTDCKVSQLTLDGQAGQPLMITLSVVGIASTFGSDESGVLDQITPYLFMHGAGALKVDATAYPLHALNLVINNNLNPFQADNFTVDNIDPQGREVSGSFSVRLGGAAAAPANYRAHFYGGTKATLTTAISGSNNDIDFTAVKGGTLGNGLTVTYVISGGGSTPVITVSGQAITVTGGTSTTAAGLLAALPSSAAGGMITGALHAGNDGTGTLASAGPLSLTGGLDDGTSQDTAFATHALDFKFTHPLNTRDLDISIPTARYADIPVQPDPSGNVIEVQAAFDAERTWPSATEGNVITVTTRDGNATA